MLETFDLENCGLENVFYKNIKVEMLKMYAYRQ